MYTFFKNIMPRWCHIRPAYFLQVLLIAGFMILSGCNADSGGYANNRTTVMSEEIQADSSNSSEEGNFVDAAETAEPSSAADNSQKSGDLQETVKSQKQDTIESNASNGRLEITFLDVGQADSILISQGQYHMLVDAENNADAEQVVNYLKNKGIRKLEYVIGTHGHEDHIGGLDEVIKSFEISKILMPKQINTTKTFEDVLVAIRNKGMKVTAPKVGDVYELGRAKWTVLAPGREEYENINNSSIVIRLTFGNNSFLFMGDAEELSEREILANNLEIKSDLIKIGHHGSSNSTTSEFLEKVSPKYAVISVGKGNDYGHPHTQTLDKLNAAGIQIYRTDISGTIIVTSDGKSITFDKKASPVKENAPPASDKPGVQTESSDSKSNISANNNAEQSKEIVVYITKTGEKYHTGGCSYLRKSSIPVKLSDAKNRGYTPCSRCNPPR
ncbi:ComEC/Rec2 family competence protein [Acetivibrio thermocellus]|uniref:ComEC/Rec2 family competence protein n=1 Tax=Acetivibrio thermocellus TaxID=1515 RepID=UPI0010A65B18|nr:ComEC/Rec2 family competence protein [Acetivibrio thermocellus]THJ79482.1 MBL fold metallo-hydrolase [Acetivibrio thermocellus]